MKPLSRIWETESFREGSPVILTQFINKLGNVGMSLLPILLVDRAYSTETSAWVMTWIKGSFPLAFLVAGWLTDRVSLRTVILLAYVLMGAGMGLIPFAPTAAVIVVFGILARFGEVMANQSVRMLLTESVSLRNQKEALGWMRFAVNLAQIFAYGLGAAVAMVGVAPLMVFDGITALLAAVFGYRRLPAVPAARSLPSDGEPERRLRSFDVFFPLASVALIFAGWTFLYDLFITGIAGKLEVLHPGNGLRLFSAAMVVNTVLCALLAVKASRVLSNPAKVFPSGLLLTAAGLLIAAYGAQREWLVFVGVLFVTLGEVTLGALGQFTLIRLLPGKKNSGSVYSLAMIVMQTGRVLGASLAFPWIVGTQDYTRLTISVGAILVAMTALSYVNRAAFVRATR